MRTSSPLDVPTPSSAAPAAVADPSVIMPPPATPETPPPEAVLLDPGASPEALRAALIAVVDARDEAQSEVARLQALLGGSLQSIAAAAASVAGVISWLPRNDGSAKDLEYAAARTEDQEARDALRSGAADLTGVNSARGDARDAEIRLIEVGAEILGSGAPEVMAAWREAPIETRLSWLPALPRSAAVTMTWQDVQGLYHGANSRQEAPFYWNVHAFLRHGGTGNTAHDGLLLGALLKANAKNALPLLEAADAPLLRCLSDEQLVSLLSNRDPEVRARAALLPARMPAKGPEEAAGSDTPVATPATPASSAARTWS